MDNNPLIKQMADSIERTWKTGPKAEPRSGSGSLDQVVLRRLVELQENYIKLLGEELDETIGLAYAHGWRSNRYEAGKRIREEIAAITQPSRNEKVSDCPQ